MHIEYMEEAIKLALAGMNLAHGGPFGAVIVKDNVIVGKGYNRVLTMKDPTAHAEITAIRDACQKLDSFWLQDCDIYTSCEPCPMCLGAIYWARIKRIYFGATREDAEEIGFGDNYFYQELATEPENRVIKQTPLMREQALKPFNEWKHKHDKTNY